MRRPRLTAIFWSAVLLATAPLCAVEPYMVKDIDPLPQNQSSSPRGFLSLDNGIVLFGANLDLFDAELWRSDGTPGGTYPLTDTCQVGYCETAISAVALAGDRLFFLAATRPAVQTATELWVSGGSAGDTLALGGPFYLDPYSPPVWVKSRGLLFFLANDLENGIELWRSDGTRAGTYRLTNVAPNQVGSQPAALTELRGKVYFAVPGLRDWSLWTSDGTPRGTKLVKDVVPYGLRSTGSALIFFGPGSKGWNLWRSDGTPKGTVRYATISPVPRGLELRETVALGGRYYFTTDGSAQGQELWASDGTQAGTRRLTNFANHRAFHYGERDALSLPTLTAGSRMIFAADDGVHGIEPWVTDGTPAGTRLLRDVCPGACWSRPIGRTTFGPRLIFAARTNDLGEEPWVTDGTPAGTRLLRDICPGVCQSFFFGMVPLAGGLLFGASDGIAQNGLQLWKTDGTPRGTTRITGFPEDVSEVRRMGAAIPGGVLYSAYSRRNGEELWRTDGTVTGTSLVLDLVDRDNGGGRPRDLLALGDRLLFLADDGVHGRELWTSDATGAGTRLVLDNDPDSTGHSAIAAHVEMGGSSYLSWFTKGRTGLWRTDGTAAGTVPLTNEEVTGVGPAVKTAGNRLFFTGSDEEHGTKLWTSDGTAAGTRALDVEPYLSTRDRLVPYQGSLYFKANVREGSIIWRSDGTPEGTAAVPFLADLAQAGGLLGEFGGRLWFNRWTEGSGQELWSTDGTEAGTRMLGDLRPGEESFVVGQLLPAGPRMFLNVQEELWVSDGTAAGTRRIGVQLPDLGGAAILDGRLFFSAFDGTLDEFDLWVSDGTESGTKRLRTADGGRLENPENLVAFAGRLWFTQGGKIWQTDGTDGGTIEVTAGISQDSELVPAGNRLFYPGWTAETGWELWAISP